MMNMTDLNIVFQHLGEFLDIPESFFERARERYQAIGTWLERDESTVSEYKPKIFPQGSFSLGTVTKPISDKDEYDIDLVCELSLSKAITTQKGLKTIVGSELETYASAHNMNHAPEERRRSWRMNYANGAQFHLDVLPAVPAYLELLSNEISITDNQRRDYTRICDDWVSCNPIDYAKWFKDRMKVQREILLKELAERFKARAADVPEYKVKTPLQRAVQILKRHRDMTHKGEPDDKPVSILITTLAGHAYNNEANIVEALVNIVNNMPRFIENRNGVLWVANPVNQLENFADKWHEYPRRQEVFLNWLNRVRHDTMEVIDTYDSQLLTKSLTRQFGESAVNKAMTGVTLSNPLYSFDVIGSTANRPRQVVTIKTPDRPWGTS